VVDGGEGGTGAAPIEFTDHIGTPPQEALLLVHNTLTGLNLRDEIRLGASGKIISAFDIARTMVGQSLQQLFPSGRCRRRPHAGEVNRARNSPVLF